MPVHEEVFLIREGRLQVTIGRAWLQSRAGFVRLRSVKASVPVKRLCCPVRKACGLPLEFLHFR